MVSQYYYQNSFELAGPLIFLRLPSGPTLYLKTYICMYVCICLYGYILAILGIELRTSHLLNQHCTTWVMSSVLNIFLNWYIIPHTISFTVLRIYNSVGFNIFTKSCNSHNSRTFSSLHYTLPIPLSPVTNLLPIPIDLPVLANSYTLNHIHWSFLSGFSLLM
jgi:hypothetical protein